MKSLIVVFALIFSNVAFAKPECSITSGPAQTSVNILAANEFVDFVKDETHFIYSCGKFVNDGTVVIGPNTRITEMDANSCAAVEGNGLNYLIYCY